MEQEQDQLEIVVYCWIASFFVKYDIKEQLPPRNNSSEYKICNTSSIKIEIYYTNKMVMKPDRFELHLWIDGLGWSLIQTVIACFQ